MKTLWESWRAECEGLPVLADEWAEGAAEEFMQKLQALVAEKRARRDAAMKLAQEIKYVHVYYEELLAFFDIESRFLRWSALNCASEQVDQARWALAEWREVLQRYCGTFPPPREKCMSFAALQKLMEEAQQAAPGILKWFRALDACLGPRPCEQEQSQDAPKDAVVRYRAA